MTRFAPAPALLAMVALAAMACVPGCTAERGGTTHAVGRYAQVRGIRMYYELHGGGPPLVLLHGGAGNGMQFEKQLPDFSPHYTCIVPDLCEQGRTTGRPGPLTYHEMAEDVLALLDQRGVRRFDLMGWSDGGDVGLDIAIHHPGRLRHLVTFGANASPTGLNAEDVAWNDTATAAAFGDGMREGYVKLSPQPGRYTEAMDKIIRLWKTLPVFTPTQLGAIRARTLICAGDHDLVRLEHTEWIARAIPGAEVWIVPNASHSAMIEHPELVNPKVLEFLAR
jgi:pimeloyl-ACP methyl ester carboxylesterase